MNAKNAMYRGFYLIERGFYFFYKMKVCLWLRAALGIRKTNSNIFLKLLDLFGAGMDTIFKCIFRAVQNVSIAALM